MNDFMYFIIAGAVLMLVPIFIIAYFQSGFFGSWIKTRAGRGKYVLLKIRGKLKDQFSTGEIKGEWLITGKKENTKRILIDDSSGAVIYRAWGVACLDIDETTNAVCSVDYKAVEGFSAEKYEGLYVRALYRPSLEENNKEKIIIILIVGAIIVGVIGLFLTWSVSQQLTSLAQGSAGTISAVI